MAKKQTESERLLALSFELQGIAFHLVGPGADEPRESFRKTADHLRDMAQAARDAEFAAAVHEGGA